MNALISCFLIHARDGRGTSRKIGITPVKGGNALAQASIDSLATYMYPWAASTEKLVNCERIVLHDGLPEELQRRFPWIRFEEVCRPEDEIVSFKRLPMCLDYLDRRPELSRVFFTDINDVYFACDPFEWHAALGISWDLPLIGEEWTRFGVNAWFHQRYHLYPPTLAKFFAENLPDSQPVTVGHWGGARHVVYPLLKSLVEMFGVYSDYVRNRPGVSWDMVLFNYIVHAGLVTRRYAAVKLEDLKANHHYAGVTIRGLDNPFLHDRRESLARLEGSGYQSDHIFPDTAAGQGSSARPAKVGV